MATCPGRPSPRTSRIVCRCCARSPPSRPGQRSPRSAGRRPTRSMGGTSDALPAEARRRSRAGCRGGMAGARAMTPYYSDDWVTLYHSRAEDALREVGMFDAVIADPPYGVGFDYGTGHDDSTVGYIEWLWPVIEEDR